MDLWCCGLTLLSHSLVKHGWLGVMFPKRLVVYVTPLVQKQPQLKGMLLSDKIHVDVKDTPSSQTCVKPI